MEEKKLFFDIDSLKQINDLIFQIYQDNPDNILENFCKTIEQFLKYDISLSSLLYYKNNHYSHFNFRSNEMDEAYINAYKNNYYYKDFGAWYNERPIPKVFRDSDIISPDLFEKSVIYKEWYAPQNVYYFVMISICGNEKKLGSIGFFRSKKLGDFTDDEVSLLEILNIHLCRRFSKLYPKGITSSIINFDTSALCFKYSLTKREDELIRLVKDGVIREMLSSKMNISPNTVKKHISNIYRKMNITSEMQFFAIINEE